jgi:hypothetical protein
MHCKDVRTHPSESAKVDVENTVTLNVLNYTGSTGFGEFYVQALVGKCGMLDVEDVKAFF